MTKYHEAYKEQYIKELKSNRWPFLFKSEYNLKCVNKYFTQIFRKLTEHEMTEEQKNHCAFTDSYRLARVDWKSNLRDVKTERDKLFIKRAILIKKLNMVDEEISKCPEDLIDLEGTL